MKGRIQPTGYVKLLHTYLDMLVTRKKIALFTDFNEANKDVLLELKNAYPEQSEAIDLCINNFNELCNLKEFFSEV